MPEYQLNERSGSQTAKLSKSQQRSELTPEQIQQQNILRLNGFSTSTILRNTNSDGSPNESVAEMDLPAPPGLTANGTDKGNSNSILPIDEDDDSKDPMERFGLKALSSLLRQDDNDQNNIAKGIDFNMLGLNLASDNKSKLLCKTLASPWLETSRSEVEPIYRTPESFRISPNEVMPLEDRVAQFNELTLFFIFYTKPRDILQELVSRELIRRNWRFHKELQVWLTKDTTVEPKQTSVGTEEGTYVFFDPISWDFVTKSLVLYYNSII